MSTLQKPMLFVLALASSHAALAQSPIAKAAQEGLKAGRPHVADEMLVQFKPEADAMAGTSALGKRSVKAVERLAARAERKDNKGDLMLVKLPKGKTMTEAVAELNADASVEFAEPNWIYRTQAVANPNDPAVNSLWGMQSSSTSPSNPYGSGALAAWNAGAACSSSVHVGVIDEGVMINHADLKANIWRNGGESAVNGVDDDRNGYVDDFNGWDFAGNNKTVYDGYTDDHGTHVAGTIAAVANNATGVFGVCPTAKLIPAKFLGSSGGSLSNAVKAVNYITALKTQKRLNIVATNNSWGGGGYSQALYDAIRAAGNANILFIAAAGNSNLNIDVSPSYPASYKLPNVIAVAAVNNRGAKASFSNWGQSGVHIAAPGESILSTVPNRSNGSTYAYYSGTSMATPHVAGAAALYASLNPCATALQIKAAILNKAAYNPQLASYVVNGRMLNVSQFRKELACAS